MQVKTAKLFESGSYPDKGIDVTDADLDTMIANHPANGVDIEVEHTKSVFSGFLGSCKKIWRTGKELFGNIEFPDGVLELANAAGAKFLSVSMPRDKKTLSEISLVRQPRIADASFSEAESPLVYFTGGIAEEPETAGKKEAIVPDQKVPEVLQVPDVNFTAALAAKDAELKTLRDDLEAGKARMAVIEFAARSTTADAKLQTLVAAGKIVPAAAEFAKAIMLNGSGAVTFGAEQTDIAALFAKFVEAQPVVIKFTESGLQTETKPQASDAAYEFAKTSFGFQGTKEEFVQFAGGAGGSF